MKPIYEGNGDAEGMVYFHKRNGEIVGRQYLRKRATAELSHSWRYHYSRETRRQAIAETVGSDYWCSIRGGELVSSVVREVEGHLLMWKGGK